VLRTLFPTKLHAAGIEHRDEKEDA
jgi:hypothetical protein